MAKKRKKNAEEDKPNSLNISAEERKKIEEKQEKQIRNVIIFSVGFIILFILAYYGIKAYNNYQNNFEYIGLKWQKQGTKQIPLYRTEFMNGAGNNIGLYMRNDPRMNNISVDIYSLNMYRSVITSFDEELERCEDAVIAQVNLIYFLRGGLNLYPEAGMFNKTQAIERNITFADCSSVANKTILVIKKSETPSIEQDKNNKDCYIINVGNCENFKATERFMLEIIKAVYKSAR